MAEHREVIIFVALLSSFVVTCYGGGALFSQLEHTLIVSSSPTGKAYQEVGDEITVTWGLDSTKANIKTESYKNVKAQLCYLPVSQKDRPWRKTVDDLKRDKTCQYVVAEKKYASNDTAKYTIEKEVPTAHYFIRVYVLDGPRGNPIAYGQTDGLDLEVKGISGRSPSIDIAASVCSAFSVVSLVYFYFMEKRRAKRAI